LRRDLFRPVRTFRADYAGSQATIDIETMGVIAGRLPPRALRLVIDWASAHRAELRDSWQRTHIDDALPEIEPFFVERSSSHPITKPTPGP
jgi:hypothetical protein